jgi:ubiquinone/menaquinone biosynthesis C-methylase UbiE
MPTIHRHAHGNRLGSFNHPERYDRRSHRFMRRLYQRVADDVAAAGLADGARVLDVGTGPGRVPLAIARALPGARVDGLDISAEMVAYAQRAAGEAGLGERVEFTEGDVADLPYEDASFDLIVSTMSQHHWADAAGGFRELRRVLRPGGRIWIYDLRFALRRAETAVRAAFPSVTPTREPLRTGWFPIHLITRLTVDPTRPAA